MLLGVLIRVEGLPQLRGHMLCGGGVEVMAGSGPRGTNPHTCNPMDYVAYQAPLSMEISKCYKPRLSPPPPTMIYQNTTSILLVNGQNSCEYS